MWGSGGSKQEDIENVRSLGLPRQSLSIEIPARLKSGLGNEKSIPASSTKPEETHQTPPPSPVNNQLPGL